MVDFEPVQGTLGEILEQAHNQVSQVAEQTGEQNIEGITLTSNQSYYIHVSYEPGTQEPRKFYFSGRNLTQLKNAEDASELIRDYHEFRTALFDIYDFDGFSLASRFIISRENSRYTINIDQIDENHISVLESLGVNYEEGRYSYEVDITEFDMNKIADAYSEAVKIGNPFKLNMVSADSQVLFSEGLDIGTATYGRIYEHERSRGHAFSHVGSDYTLKELKIAIQENLPKIEGVIQDFLGIIFEEMEWHILDYTLK